VTCCAGSAAGLGAGPVLAPEECWDDKQIRFSQVVVEDNSEQFVGLPLTMRQVSPAPGALEPGLAQRARSGNGSAPLSGIRVVDFGNFAAGPLTGRILSDLGADAVAVSPSADLPSIAPPRQSVVAQRGMLSVGINLKSEEGPQAARRLCAHSDVVVHNLRVGVAHRLGMDPRRCTHSTRP
jgi:crotonobetainyl-CoA:carnitine CoA-transferase CaiB-like acyl-CoA transferase